VLEALPEVSLIRRRPHGVAERAAQTVALAEVRIARGERASDVKVQLVDRHSRLRRLRIGILVESAHVGRAWRRVLTCCGERLVQRRKTCINCV
jgi:hypothetical protein